MTLEIALAQSEIDQPCRQRADGDGQDHVRDQSPEVDGAPRARPREGFRAIHRPAGNVGDQEQSGERRRGQHRVAMPRHVAARADEVPPEQQAGAAEHDAGGAGGRESFLRHRTGERGNTIDEAA